MQNLTSDSCSSTPISYWGDEISRLSCLVNEIPILGYFGVLGVFSYFKCKIWRRILARRPRISIRWRNFAPIVLSYRDPYFGLPVFGFLGFWGYLSTSGAKSDVIWYTVTYRFKCWIKQCSRLFCFSHAELWWRRGGGFHPPLSIRCLQKSLAMRGLTDDDVLFTSRRTPFDPW